MAANYSINQEAKRITVRGALTEAEQNVLQVYIAAGFKVYAAQQEGKRVNKKDILNWIEEKNAGYKEKFEADIKKVKYLQAVKLFKEANPTAWEEIKAKKKKKDKSK